MCKVLPKKESKTENEASKNYLKEKIKKKFDFFQSRQTIENN